MDGKYQAYPEYRDSGIEWLDKIPSHWSSVPIKYMALDPSSMFLDGDWIESKDISGDEIRYITTGNVGEGHYKEQGTGFITEEKFQQLNCTEVFEGDILISRLNEPIGRSCIVPKLNTRIVTSVDNVIFRIDEKYNEKYVVHLFTSKEYFKHTSNLARGATMQRISRGLLGNIRVVIPPLEEQEKIANFLDHETAKIDTLIDKQQQLIQLLKEKRQAVISHAVTKGLNPNAPMRDSGVEWLGEVPEHWKVSSLGYYATVSTGATPDRSNPQYWNGDIPWVKTGEVKYDEIFETEEHITPYGVMGSAVTISPPGTLLMAMYGQGVTRGRVALLGVHATYNQACAAIIPNSKVWNLYLRYFFMAAYHAIRDGGNETSQMNLSAELVGKFKITIPTITEQYKIVEFLDDELKKTDFLLDKAVVGIKLMQERRTALISAAVTGKIDVRDWETSVSKTEFMDE